MNLPIWLPSVGLFIIAGFGYFLGRTELLQAAKSVKNQKAFMPEVKRLPRDLLKPLPTIIGDVWTGDNLRAAVSDIIDYARDFNADWIAGVNPGGLVLAAYIAEKIGSSKVRCLYLRHNVEEDNIEVIKPAPFNKTNYVAGRVLVVDDISRTGTVFSKVRDFMASKNGMDQIDLEAVRFACLLVVSGSSAVRSGFRPDWAYARTGQKNLMFPWTPITHAMTLIYSTKAKGIRVSENNTVQYDNFIRNINIPLEIAKKILG